MKVKRVSHRLKRMWPCQKYLRYSGIIPSPVDKQQPGEEPELGDGKVGRVCCLQPLVAGYADADVGLLDHGDVVGAVADGQRDLVANSAFLHHLHYLRLLHRRDAAADHALTTVERVNWSNSFMGSTKVNSTKLSYSKKQQGVKMGVSAWVGLGRIGLA